MSCVMCIEYVKNSKYQKIHDQTQFIKNYRKIINLFLFANALTFG